MEYDIVRATADRRLYAFEVLVEIMKHKVADGWKPQGGPFVQVDYIMQAVVREEPAHECRS